MRRAQRRCFSVLCESVMDAELLNVLEVAPRL